MVIRSKTTTHKEVMWFLQILINFNFDLKYKNKIWKSLFKNKEHKIELLIKSQLLINLEKLVRET